MSGHGGSVRGSDDQRFNSLQLWIDQVGHEPYWTPERIVARIQRWARDHDGRPPSRKEWSRSRRHPNRPGHILDRPSTSWVANVFGSWSAAIEAAGFVPGNRRKRRPRKRCKHGHPLTPENVYLDRNGGRQCRQCTIDHAIRRYRQLVPDAKERSSHAAVRASYPRIRRMWVKGLTIREIADELGVTVSVAASRIAAMRAAGWELPARPRGRRRAA